MFAIIMGNIDSGKRRMLKSERATNAFSESKMLSGDDRTYTANVAKATCKHITQTLSEQPGNTQYKHHQGNFQIYHTNVAEATCKHTNQMLSMHDTIVAKTTNPT